MKKTQNRLRTAQVLFGFHSYAYRWQENKELMTHTDEIPTEHPRISHEKNQYNREI
jgi:hypothetical protein